MSRESSEATIRFGNAKNKVETYSNSLKKELSLTNASLMQILILLQFTWIGAAAQLGQSHVLFWLLAILLFFIPLASVVIYLSRVMPLEGGLYQWTKLGFNNFWGFMVGWNYYLSNIVFVSLIGLEAANFISYIVAGSSDSWIADNKIIIITANCLVISLLTIISVIGLGVGKWFYNACGVIRIFLLLMLAALPLLFFVKASEIEYRPFAITLPTLSLLNLNILGKMAFGAFSGFEEVAVFAGECKNAPRTLSKSVIVATPVVAILYILATSSVVTFIPPNEVDLIGTVQQTFTAGLQPFGINAQIVPIISVALLLLLIAVNGVVFAQNVRLPMTAGWDRLLGKWFTRLHTKYKTPVNSIIFSSTTALVLGLISLIGINSKEAFQFLLNTSFILWALTYLAMFLLPLVGLKGVEPRPSVRLKIMSVCGFLMTFLYVTLSIFPIVDVESWFVFAIKIMGVIVVVNAIGIYMF